MIEIFNIFTDIGYLFAAIIVIIPPIFATCCIVNWGFENFTNIANMTGFFMNLLLVIIPSLGIYSYVIGNSPFWTFSAFLINTSIAQNIGMVEAIFDLFTPEKNDDDANIIEGVFTIISDTKNTTNNTRTIK